MVVYETGTATDMDDLVSKLFTFAVANGWTQDQLDTTNNKAALHKGSVYISFRWSTATPNNLALYQALGYTGGNDPGNHPDDSGNGFVTGTDTGTGSLDRSRALSNIGNGPYPHYYFFLDTAPDYIHIVVEFSTGIFRHASFGEVNKVGTWTGGEYCYGSCQVTGQGVTDTSNLMSLDGLWFNLATSGAQAGTSHRGPTIHMEGVFAQPGSSKWGKVYNNTSTNPALFLPDRAGNPVQRLLGGFKSGPIASGVGWVKANVSNGFVPMYAIGFYYWDISLSPEQFSLLGFLPDTKGVNCAGFAPAQEVTIGGETWMIFPVSRKADTNAVDDSRNIGIAYKKAG